MRRGWNGWPRSGFPPGTSPGSTGLRGSTSARWERPKSLCRSRPESSRHSMIAADRVAALLLAAGESRRFGSADKLAAPLGDRMLAAHAAQVIADGGFGASIAVCRAGGERTIDLVAGLSSEEHKSETQ